ncbi:LexA family protein [Algihabitans albus]|uniref:LexA family protein n=1 Tax=Algihabitans albus TaxID=2164067 RepID=UPI0013C34892|nr:XRE family transcriptional regulator [Algihabitans albus]
MSQVAERLRQAREAAGYTSAAAFARAMGMLDATYRHHENGQRTPGPEQIRDYAKKLNVPYLWLLTGESNPKELGPVQTQIHHAPIISWVEAGQWTASDTMPAGSGDVVIVSHMRSTVFALRVHGNSMDRIAPEESVIVVDYGDRDLIDGRYYVFRLSNGGEATFKRYRANPTRLEPDSTHPHETIFPDETVEVIGRVIQVIKEI